MLSISNVFNNIASFVPSDKYNNRPVYYIERSIFKALAYDKDLTNI